MTRTTSVRTVLFGLVLCTSAACDSFELPGALGAQCDLNSDCDAPLVCRIELCRVECASSRDCAIGFDCVFDGTGRGACQLEAETSCTLNSDCKSPLVCTMGECTNVCECDPDSPPDACYSRDCPPGATCIESDGDGGRACLDTSTRGCVYDSDCGVEGESLEVCGGDARCRVECLGPHDSRNCRNGETCESASFALAGGDVIRGYLCVFTGTAPIAADAGADGGP
jgi:hypothetical protein